MYNVTGTASDKNTVHEPFHINITSSNHQLHGYIPVETDTTHTRTRIETKGERDGRQSERERERAGGRGMYQGGREKGREGGVL